MYTFTPSAPRPNFSAVVVVLEIVQRLHWCVSHLENNYLFFGVHVQAFFGLICPCIKLNLT